MRGPAQVHQPPIRGADLEQLVDLHLRGHLEPADVLSDAGLLEILRLAHLGAAAELEASLYPATLNRSVVDAIGGRWARIVGTP